MSERDKKEVAYIMSKKKQAEDAMRERRAIMDELWMLYQNKQDWTNKKAWQSRVFVPKVFMTIEQAAAVVKRAVLSTATLFSLKVRRGKKGKEQIELAKTAKSEVEKRFKEFIDDTNFADSVAPYVITECENEYNEFKRKCVVNEDNYSDLSVLSSEKWVILLPEE